MHGSCGIQHYAVNSMLYLRTVKDKYIEIYYEFISLLCIYSKAVRILAKGYLPISLITPLKLQEIINLVKEMLIKTNPDYDIVIKLLHLCYNMKLVMYYITINIISIGNCPSAHSRLKHKGRLIHSTLDKETIFSIKHRKVHKHLTTGIS